METEAEYPEKDAFQDVETPERTPFQKVLILDRKLDALEDNIKLKQAQLKQASGIIQKIKINQQIRQLKAKKHELCQQLQELMPDWR